MAERLIDAEAYKSYIRKTYCQYCDGCFDEWRHDDCWQLYAIKTLEAIPTIEAKPVVHAHWETDFDFDPEEEQEIYFYFCSKCKNELFGNKEDFKYCPYCGAQMDENHIAEVGKKEGE